MVISLGVLGGAFLLAGSSSIVAWLAVISLAVYVACFAIGLGPVFWLLISEIYPLKIRGRAMGVATMMNWGSNLIVALTFPQLAAFPGTQRNLLALRSHRHHRMVLCLSPGAGDERPHAGTDRRGVALGRQEPHLATVSSRLCPTCR